MRAWLSPTEANRPEIRRGCGPRCGTQGHSAPAARLFGLAAQLYSLQRPGNVGFGNTEALNDIVTGAAREGADAVRLSLTTAYLRQIQRTMRPTRLEQPVSQSTLCRSVCRPRPRVRRRARPIGRPAFRRSVARPVASAKYALLLRIQGFRRKRVGEPGNALTTELLSFEREGGERLRDHALFEALR